MMDPHHSKPMTISQAMKALGISRGRVYALLYAGQIEGWKVAPASGGPDQWALDAASVARVKREQDNPVPIRLGLWDRDQVAEYLGCTTSAVSNMVNRGHLTCQVFCVDSRYRAYYDPDEVRAYAESRQETNPLGPACTRCTLIAPLNDAGLCEICQREKSDGGTYWYPRNLDPAARIALPEWEECWV